MTQPVAQRYWRAGSAGAAMTHCPDRGRIGRRGGSRGFWPESASPSRNGRGHRML